MNVESWKFEWKNQFSSDSIENDGTYFAKKTHVNNEPLILVNSWLENL